MNRIGSMLVLTAIAAVFFWAAKCHAASEPGPPPGAEDPPPPVIPDPPASILGEVFGSSAQIAIQTTTFQYGMLSQRIRNADAARVPLLAGPAVRPSQHAQRHGWTSQPWHPALLTETLGSTDGDDGLQLTSWDNDTLPVFRGQNAPLTCSEWGAFGSIYDVGGSVDATLFANGLDYDAGGTQWGAYRFLDSETTVGLFGGYTHQNIDVNADSKSSNIHSGQLGTFLHRSDASKYWLLAGAVAYDDYDIARSTDSGTARGDFDGVQSSAYTEAGSFIPWGAIVLEPSAALQYIWLRQNGFTETGAGADNLSFAKTDTNSLRSIVGVRCKREHPTNWGCLRPELRAQWMHEFLDTATSVLIAAGGPTGTSIGVDLGRDWAVLGGGVTLDIGGATSLFANYDVQFNDRSALHVAGGGAQWEW